jgi:hypothetical protein
MEAEQALACQWELQSAVVVGFPIMAGPPLNDRQCAIFQ